MAVDFDFVQAVHKVADGDQAQTLSGFAVANGKPFTLVARIEAPEQPGFYPLVSEFSAPVHESTLCTPAVPPNCFTTCDTNYRKSE